MKRLPDQYWALFRVIHERTVPVLTQNTEPGMLNRAFGLPEPQERPRGRTPSGNERYWLGWMQEFSEIHESVERQYHSLVFLKHFPASRGFRFHGISEADWLRYHVEAYLQEAYIFSTRLKRFLRRVEKTAIASGDKAGVASARRMMELAERALKSLVDVRGAHVHERRFHDPALQDLGILVLVSKHSKARELRAIRRINYASSLEKWSKRLRQSNKEVMKLCIPLFEVATEILVRNEPPEAAKAI